MLSTMHGYNQIMICTADTHLLHAVKVCPESNLTLAISIIFCTMIDLGVMNNRASFHSKSRYHHREITVDVVAMAAGL